MFKRFIPLALAAALATTAAAAAGVTLSDEVKQQITAKLTADGYEVGKIKVEDGLYEAYAKKDGQRLEIFMDAALEVVRTKVDD